MNPRQELFRAAAEYHGAVAAHCRVRRDGGDVEDSAQRVIGRALCYRMAIDAVIENERERAFPRLSALRSLLRSFSAYYNIAKRLQRRA